ncbi:MAG: hypothetical protein ACYC3I_02180 [Gemmataceae bacterium]
MSRGAKDDSPMVDPDSVPRYPEERQLDAFFKAQPPCVIYMLTAIMYLGRGDFKVKSLRHQYEEISESFGGKLSGSSTPGPHDPRAASLL